MAKRNLGEAAPNTENSWATRGVEEEEGGKHGHPTALARACDNLPCLALGEMK